MSIKCRRKCHCEVAGGSQFCQPAAARTGRAIPDSAATPAASLAQPVIPVLDTGIPFFAQSSVRLRRLAYP